MKKTYCFDIDGVVCSNTEGEYQNAIPDNSVILKINKLYHEGHKIILFTARGSVTGIDWKEITKKQMHDWQVNYHELLFGKPFADIYIDDKAINSLDWIKEN
ncbi:MAG: hypothetical protein A3F13_04955 [Gammaproteobacteria bacterium RIFCSPHIGHO2_12_FULL_40_19]|nr:MAG: hypothetical protein A3F13_04955 [Gammaproteobacteria bacterium RIFCSPHIGHO2_12_FULL_40_19]